MGLPINEAFNPPYLIFPTEVLSVEINSFRSPSNKKYVTTKFILETNCVDHHILIFHSRIYWNL